MNEWSLNQFKNQCDSIKQSISIKIAKCFSFESTITKEYIDNLKGKKGDKKYLA